MMREDFPLLEKYLYLDNAASSLKPKSLFENYGDLYINSYSNVHRGIHKLSQEISKKYEYARKNVSSFFGYNDCFFTSGATLGLNQVISGLDLSREDTVILSETEHHSNQVPWMNLGVKIKYVKLKKDLSIDFDHLISLIDSSVKVISIPWVSNLTGKKYDIKKVCKLASENKILTVIDGSQAAGHTRIDAKPDFLIFSGHKMLGPTGIGVVCSEKLNLIQPRIYGGGMVESVSYETYSFLEPPYSLEAGTPPFMQAILLSDCVNYIKKIGVNNIEKHVKELTSYTISKLKSKVNLISAEDSEGIVSFTLPNLEDVAYYLAEKNVCFRIGHHCVMPYHEKLNVRSLRISFYFYNNKEDVDSFIEILGEIMRKLSC